MLYELFGYKIKDELIYFKGHVEKKEPIDVEFIQPKLLPKLPIYNEDVSWQYRVQSYLSAQAAIFYDRFKTLTVMGYLSNQVMIRNQRY